MSVFLLGERDPEMLFPWCFFYHSLQPFLTYVYIYICKTVLSDLLCKYKEKK